MCPDMSCAPSSSLARQQGSMLIMAIFIIVVVGLLVSAFSVIFSSSQTAVSYEVLGARAQAAANAGVEAGLYRILRKAAACNVMASGSTTPTTALSVTLDTSAVALSQCTVSVLCGQRPAVSASSASYFVLNSTASCIAGNNNLTATRVIKSEVQR